MWIHKANNVNTQAESEAPDHAVLYQANWKTNDCVEMGLSQSLPAANRLAKDRSR